MDGRGTECHAIGSRRSEDRLKAPMAQSSLLDFAHGPRLGCVSVRGRVGFIMDDDDRLHHLRRTAAFPNVVASHIAMLVPAAWNSLRPDQCSGAGK